MKLSQKHLPPPSHFAIKSQQCIFAIPACHLVMYSCKNSWVIRYINPFSVIHIEESCFYACFLVVICVFSWSMMLKWCDFMKMANHLDVHITGCSWIYSEGEKIQYSLSFSVQLADLCSLVLALGIQRLVLLTSCCHCTELLFCAGSHLMSSAGLIRGLSADISALALWFHAVAPQLYRDADRCSPQIWILTVSCSLGHTHCLSLSLSLFLLLCQLSLSSPLVHYAGKYAWTGYKACQTSHSLPCGPPSHYTAVLISHRFQSVSQPDHINPQLSRLHSPQLSLTFFQKAHTPSFQCSFHVSLSFSPSQSVRVSEFPPQCRIPDLISRYAGTIGIGQQAVPVIPESYWIKGDIKQLLETFVVEFDCPYFVRCPWSLSNFVKGTIM